MFGQTWRVPDVGFTHAQLEAAASVVADLSGASRGPELAFVGGHRTCGLGLVNETVDLYLVGGATVHAGTVQEVDGTRVKLKGMCPEKTSQLIKLATEYRATSTYSPQLAADAGQIGDLVRLVTGLPLMATPAWTERLEAISEDAVRQMLISRNALAFAACAADVFDCLRSGDLFTALTMSNAGLYSGCSAALAALGDFALGVKFVFRRLVRSCVTAPWCGYLWRLFNWPFPEEELPSSAEVKAIAEERLLAANLLLAVCATDGWDKQLTALPAPPESPGLEPATGPRRSAYFTAVRFADAWTLLGPGQGYQTVEEVVRLWQRLDGHVDPEEFGAELATSRGDDGRLRPTHVNSIVSAMHELGALELPMTLQDPPPEAAQAPIIRSARFDLTARGVWDLDMSR
jgi:hypothetical protein